MININKLTPTEFYKQYMNIINENFKKENMNKKEK